MTSRAKQAVAITAGILFFGAAVVWSKRDNRAGQDRQVASFGHGNPQQQRILDEVTRQALLLKNRTGVNAALKSVLSQTSGEEFKVMPAVQVFRAFASLLSGLEGIVWRCRGLIEVSDWMHMSALFSLRSTAYNDYLYGPHIRALFDYLTFPSVRVGEEFKSMRELQGFLIKEVAPRLEAYVDGMAKLESLPASEFEFEFDRTLLSGVGNGLRFIDPEETRKTFTKSTFYTLEFLLQRALMTIYYVSALDLDEFPVLANQVIRDTTINMFKGNLRVGRPAKGVTPQMIFGAVWGSTRNLFNFRKDVDSQRLLNRAFEYGKRSAEYQLAAYVCGIKLPAGRVTPAVQRSRECESFDSGFQPEEAFIARGDRFLYNPNSMLIGFKKKYHAFRDRVFAYREAEAGRTATITSDVTGESLRINLKAIFDARNSPRRFFPTEFRDPEQAAVGVTLINKRETFAWNYDHGKPVTFPDPSFGGLFDQSQVKDTASLYRAMTTLLYTDAVAPFAAFVRVPSPVQFFVPVRDIVDAN